MREETTVTRQQWRKTTLAAMRQGIAESSLWTAETEGAKLRPSRKRGRSPQTA